MGAEVYVTNCRSRLSVCSICFPDSSSIAASPDAEVDDESGELGDTPLALVSKWLRILRWIAADPLNPN